MNHRSVFQVGHRSFSFFMTEAILLFSPHGSPIRMLTRRSKVRVHWVLQCACLACAALGLASIVYNKHLVGKAHFASWHGLLGLVAVCVAGLQCLAAVSLVYPSLVRGWPLARLKRWHAAAGLLAYLLGGGSLVLGVRSAWFTASVGGLAWYLAALCPAVSGLVVVSQVTDAYMANKRLQS
ncbi:unnamed protein product [Merluccius merluccius]